MCRLRLGRVDRISSHLLPPLFIVPMAVDMEDMSGYCCVRRPLQEKQDCRNEVGGCVYSHTHAH